MLPFANTSDVELRWRSLSTSEQPIAETLIDDASDMIRVRWPDIDSRVAGGSVSTTTMVRIVAGMVRRAMMNRDSEGVTQQQQTAGPFSQGATYSNPNNNLYLSADDIRQLDPAGFAPRVKMGWLI